MVIVDLEGIVLGMTTEVSAKVLKRGLSLGDAIDLRTRSESAQDPPAFEVEMQSEGTPTESALAL